jgi:type 1 glutamine amidotransferase
VKLVLVASKQDHGPGQHDYPRWQTNWARLLARDGAPSLRFAVDKAWEWPSPAQFAAADVLVFYSWNRGWSDARYAELDAFQQRGGGVVVLHAATIADQEPEKLAARLGLAAQPGRTGYRHMPFTLRLAAGAPLLRGLPAEIEFLDEPYWPLIGDPARVQVLATAEVDGAARPLVWAFERGPGRVFASIPGHYSWTLDDPLFRVLILRGIAWAAGRPAGAADALALAE